MKVISRPQNKQIYDAGLKSGLSPLISRIIAARPMPIDTTPTEFLDINLTKLSSPFNLVDINKASKRLANAIIHKECIGIETDHDCDGQTSHAVIYYNLANHFKHPKELIKSYIGHRLTEGYGLSEPVMHRILNDDPQPKLVITADNGSTDEPRIKILKENGIDVIVTDHHQIPTVGIPESAYACINPTRDDCGYGDKLIAGCMVAWLLMAATRQELINYGYLEDNCPKLIDTLDFVAVGTIADCVSMARSKNNRAIVKYGLNLITKGIKPCWRALKDALSDPVTAEDLGFKIGPLLNSDGRLACAFGSVSFLLAENDLEATQWVSHLQEQNIERKKIQKNITNMALDKAKAIVAKGHYSICVYLDDGHSGVHGISASRIKDHYGRPCAIFAPKVGSDGIISGSLRGVDGMHIQKSLQMVADMDTNIMLAFGGHTAAGGVTLQLNNFDKFCEYFEIAVRRQLNQNDLGAVVYTDGLITADDISLNTLEELKVLEPFGREFEQPIFQAKGEVVDLKPVGDGTHLKLAIKIDGKIFKGIWFGFRQNGNDPIPVEIKNKVECVFSLMKNSFMNNVSCELNFSILEIST